jgi:hypothetical protein
MFLLKISLIMSLMKGGKRLMNIMVDVYTTLIVAKVKTIDMVPPQLQSAVLAQLTAMGLDGYGNPLPVAPTEPVTP